MSEDTSTKRSAVRAAALAGTALLVTTGVAPALAHAATATEAQQTTDQRTPIVEQAVNRVATQVRTDKVVGQFGFDQTTLTSNAAIKSAFAGTNAFLCNSLAGTDEASVPIDQWTIKVDGDVSSAFTATLGDLADDNALTVQMGCACAGNGADQRVVANAEVTGVTLMDIMRQAGVGSDANTVTFTSSDGYQVSLPLSYVKQRYSLIVYSVNGEPLENSMGGTNQLWLGSTSANYFARDITGITFEARDAADVPAAPGTAQAGDSYANSPNVGVLQGSVA